MHFGTKNTLKSNHNHTPKQVSLRGEIVNFEKKTNKSVDVLFLFSYIIYKNNFILKTW
jgi:hypothetical protein